MKAFFKKSLPILGTLALGMVGAGILMFIGARKPLPLITPKAKA